MYVSSMSGRTSLAWSPAALYAALSASVVVLLAVSFFLFPLGGYFFFSDYWEHLANVRELMRDPWSPGNPQLVSPDGSRGFMPWYLALAVLGRALDLAPATALAVGATATTALFFLGAHLFARAYYASAWAPLLLAVTLLCGMGLPFQYTGFHNLRSQLQTNAYPAAFVLSLALLAWALALEALHDRRRPVLALAGVALLSALMVACHQLSGFFGLGALGCFVLFDRAPGRPWSNMPRKAALLAAAALGLWLSRLWPYFDPLGVLSTAGNPNWDGPSWFYDPATMLAGAGPALLGLPVLGWLAWRRTRLELVAGALGLGAAYLGGGMIDSPVAHRFFPFAVLFLQLALVWLLLAVLDPTLRPEQSPLPLLRQSGARRIALGGLALFGLAHLGSVALDYGRVALFHREGVNIGSYALTDIPAAMETVAAALPEDAVVLAPGTTAYPVPAVKARVVSIPRPLPLVRDLDRRQADTAAFFAPEAAPETRTAVIARYGATHVLFRPGEDVDEQTHAALLDLGPVRAQTPQLVLVEIGGQP